MIGKFSTVIFAIFLAAVTVSPLIQAETLDEAVNEMIMTNPDVRSVAFNRLAREQEVRQARSGYFPTVDLVAGAGKDYVKKPFDEDLSPQLVNLSLRQNLFNGLASMNEVERQEARVRSEAYIVRSTADKTALKTAKVYLDVLSSDVIHELAQENLTIHQRITDQIKLRSESGVSRRAEMDQIQTRLTLAQSNVIVTEQNRLDAKTNYLALVGHMPSGLSRPTVLAEWIPASLEEAEQFALGAHPTLQSAHADIDARKSQDEVAKSPFMPIVDLELDQIYESETNYSFEEREDFRALIRLRYNLFNGWKDHARKAETVHLINEAREIRNHTHRQVIESMRLSWMAYKAAVNKTSYLEQRVTFATATAKAYTKQWNIGKRTLLDVLDSEAERIDAMQQLITAEYEMLYAQYRIINGMGRLVPSLGLAWPQEGLLEEENES